MTAEASRKKTSFESMDAFGPPGSNPSASDLSATPPDPTNMAALLMSMMERMERSERRTVSVIGEMQARLAEISRNAESASVAVEEPAAPVTGKNGAETSTFALLEQRLGAFQVPARETPAAQEATAPAYRTAAEASKRIADPKVIPARRSEDASRDPGHEAPVSHSVPAETAKFIEPGDTAASPVVAEPTSSVLRAEPMPEAFVSAGPQVSTRAAERLAEQFKSGVESRHRPPMGAAAEPPPIMERRRPQSDIGLPGGDEQPSERWPAWRAPCRETSNSNERLSERCRLEDQFDSLAARLEGGLSVHQSSTEIEALSEKLDAVSRELADALAEPAEALTSIEHQLTDIARSFGQTEQRLNKMNDLEVHLAKLTNSLAESPGLIDRAAETAATRVMQLSSSGSNDALAMRIDAMHAELTAFDGRSRAQGDRMSGIVETIQRRLNDLVDTRSDGSPVQTARAEEKRALPAAPQAQEAAGMARPQPKPKLDADFDDEPAKDKPRAPEVREPDTAAQPASLRERLGASIPDFQPSVAQPKAKQNQTGDRPQSGPADRKDDFIAAARKAAQAAAARANEKSKPSAKMHEGAMNQHLSSKPAENHLSRPRPVLVISAAVLLIASAALLYTRLQSKPSAPAAPAIEQQQGKGKSEKPAKSSNALSESMLASGSEGAKQGNKFNDRLDEEPQLASIAPDEARIGSVVVKSLGDDDTALGNQVALPPASIGPYSMRLAAARGEMVAQYFVANRFAEGKGVPQNWEEAGRWYARAAAQGHAPAQYRFAVMFERGQGVEKDPARARVWYTRAADQGNLKAMHNLAVTMSGPDATPDDHAIAAQWFAKAAEQGLADSQFNLAIFFENGLGLNRDVVEAYKWYTLAANQMDVEAAKRRDLLRAQLDEKALAAADKAVRAWRPVQARKPANEVETPDASWGATAAGL